MDVNGATAGAILSNLRRTGPLTREELRASVGLSRATLVERLDVLTRLRLIRTAGYRASSGGRRAELLAVDEASRVVLALDIGVTHAAVAVVDLTGTIVDSHRQSLPTQHHPDEVLPQLCATGRRLLTQTGRRGDLAAVGVSLPGQIDQQTGITIVPPSLPDWSDLPLRPPFATEFGVPVLIENDANALALGEHRAAAIRDSTMLGVKVGTGIGAGVAIGTTPHRGATGCAGEIGHIHIEGRTERCTCGLRGCVAALASGRALLRQLRPTGARTMSDVIRRIQSADPSAVRLATEAGKLLGDVLATVVTILNPDFVRIGGEIGVLGPYVDGVITSVTSKAHRVALRNLDIGPAAHADSAPLVGLAALATEHVLAPAAVDALAVGS
jgi:predicted NBD/HSP70 family sugar kinase